MKKENKKISKSLIFMLSVFAIYFLLFLINKYLILEALINTAILFLKLLPVLLLVFIISLLTNYFIKNEKIKNYLRKEHSWKGWLYAIIAGILISGPPYILFPLWGDLQKAGMSNKLLAVVLYNRNVKIPFIPVMIYYFGLAYTVIISIYIVLFSILNGYLVGMLTNRK